MMKKAIFYFPVLDLGYSLKSKFLRLTPPLGSAFSLHGTVTPKDQRQQSK